MTDWKQILDDNAHSLWQVVYQLLSNSHEASECFKEAFISVYEESTQRPIRDNNIYPNIAKAAIGKALDKLHQRFQSKSARQDATDMVIIPTNGPKPLAKIESQELAGRLRKALSQVPAQKAQIFCLAKFVGLSNKQIAKTYGLNKKAVTVLIHQTKEKLACFLELRDEERKLGENKNIVNDAVAAIKQESVSTNPPGKTLHDITKILPVSAEPQLSEAMQKKNKIVRRIKALNKFRIIAAIVVLAGAVIAAKLFTFIQQKQLEKANENSNLVVTKPAGLKSDIDKADDIDSLDDSAEIEFAKVMESFTTGDANGITRLFEGDNLLNRIILAKFLGEMGDEKSIQTLELFYNDTRDQLRGKIEPNPFLDAIEKIQARLGYEEVKIAEPEEANTPAAVKEPQKTIEPEKQRDITGDVVSIEGYAAENADVIVSNAANPAMIVNGQVADGSGLEITTTDSQGKFVFAEIENDSLITVIHELGFGEITKQALQQDPTVVLTGWGYVTGQLLIENAPASNQA
ncbi:MAG: sigma-70 family RNA polymerase sigma factor, partial [Planctomycetes bacterium]|nr:sigma-70 family RNA polymerase sigma factor [Planctomycetota bacterium]